jgi:hypothetical protein
MGYTPGPWEIEHSDQEPDSDGNSHIWIRPSEFRYGRDYLRVSGWMSEENARIISAAPDLLEALIMVRDADEDCKRDGLPTIPNPARWKIDAAIAKAVQQLDGGDHAGQH